MGRQAAWFDSVDVRTALWCRVTQQGFLRLASNPSVFGAEALTLRDAWSCYDALRGDERTGFVAEAAGLERLWREHTSSGTLFAKGMDRCISWWRSLRPRG